MCTCRCTIFFYQLESQISLSRSFRITDVSRAVYFQGLSLSFLSCLSVHVSVQSHESLAEYKPKEGGLVGRV